MPILALAAPNPSWTKPVAPFQIADNLYYVGSQDLASYLVVTAQGNILINANFTSSPPQIRASVERLGFRWKDIRILLNSQAKLKRYPQIGPRVFLDPAGYKNFVAEGQETFLQASKQEAALAK